MRRAYPAVTGSGLRAFGATTPPAGAGVAISEGRIRRGRKGYSTEARVFPVVPVFPEATRGDQPEIEGIDYEWIFLFVAPPSFFFRLCGKSGPFHFFTVHATPSRFRGSTVLDVGMLEHADRGTYAMSKPAYTSGEKIASATGKTAPNLSRQLSPVGSTRFVRRSHASLIRKSPYFTDSRSPPAVCGLCHALKQNATRAYTLFSSRG